MGLETVRERLQSPLSHQESIRSSVSVVHRSSTKDRKAKLLEALRRDREAGRGQHTYEYKHNRTNDPRRLLPGDILETERSTYEIIGPIGKGTFGRVDAATDLATSAKVAIKQQRYIRTGVQADELRQELTVLAGVRHPNIARMLEAPWHDELGLLLVQEHYPSTLTEWMEREGRLSPEPARRLLDEMLAGLEAMQSRGLVHLDLKPDNILLDNDGRPVLADFSTSDLVHDVEHLSGTPFYMAPEMLALDRQWRRQLRRYDIDITPEIGPWSDYPAIGLMTYQLLCGRQSLPWSDDLDEPAFWTRWTPSGFDEIRKQLLHLPDDLARLIASSLAVDPQERPTSARQMRAMLSLDRSAMITADRIGLPSSMLSEAAESMAKAIDAYPPDHRFVMAGHPASGVERIGRELRDRLRGLRPEIELPYHVGEIPPEGPALSAIVGYPGEYEHNIDLTTATITPMTRPEASEMLRTAFGDVVALDEQAERLGEASGWMYGLAIDLLERLTKRQAVGEMLGLSVRIDWTKLGEVARECEELWDVYGRELENLDGEERAVLYELAWADLPLDRDLDRETLLARETDDGQLRIQDVVAREVVREECGTLEPAAASRVGREIEERDPRQALELYLQARNPRAGAIATDILELACAKRDNRTILEILEPGSDGENQDGDDSGSGLEQLLWPDPESEMRGRLVWTRALRRTRRLDRVDRILDRARELGEELGDKVMLSMLRTEQFGVAAIRGQLESLESIGKHLQEARELGDPEALAWAAMLRCGASYSREPERSIQSFIADIEGIAPKDLSLDAYGSICALLTNADLDDHRARRASEWLDGREYPADLLPAGLLEAGLAQYREDFSSAYPLYKRLTRLAFDWDSEGLRRKCIQGIKVTGTYLGKLVELRYLFRHLLCEEGDPAVVAVFRNLEAEIGRLRGDLGTAWKINDHKGTNPAQEWTRRTVEANIHRISGLDPRKTLHALMEDTDSVDTQDFCWLYTWTALSELEHGTRDHARAMIKKALMIKDAHELTLECKYTAVLAAARIALYRGEPTLAREHLTAISDWRDPWRQYRDLLWLLADPSREPQGARGLVRRAMTRGLYSVELEARMMVRYLCDDPSQDHLIDELLSRMLLGVEHLRESVERRWRQRRNLTRELLCAP